MLPKVETWMFYRGDGKKAEDDIAAISVSARDLKAVPVSQYIELRDKDDNNVVTITWPSTVKVRKVGN